MSVSAYAQATIDQLQSLITKPTLKPALLEKPPFRFIHDIITNLQSAQSFPPQSLFDEAQLDSSKVTEKDDKLKFLNRIIEIVQAVNQSTIDVSPAKIIAGLEADKTNALFQALAQATNKRLSEQQIVALLNPPAAAAQPKPAPAKPAQSVSQPAQPLRQPSPPATQPSSQSVNQSFDPNETYIARTQRLLGALITKPTLSEKLLSKPPFRFIHDCITAVFRSIQSNNQWPGDYFDSAELDSATLDTPDKKINFLTKFIRLLSVTLEIDQSITQSVDLSVVSPKKIIAGLEPENTNLMLQALALCANTGVSINQIIARINQSSQPASQANSQPPQTALKRPSAPSANQSASQSTNQPTNQPTNQAANQPNLSVNVGGSPTVPKLSLRTLDKTEELGDIINNQANNQSNNPSTKFERPMTARAGPPKPVTQTANQPTTQPATEEETKEDPTANQSNKQASNQPTVISGAAKQNDRRGVILESDTIDEDINEDIDQSNDQTTEEEDQTINEAEAGGLMRKIIQAGQTGDEKEEKSQSNKTNQTNKATQPNTNDELKTLLQKVCHSVNPLGKCMDSLAEDFDEIARETHRWRKQREEYAARLEEETAQTVLLLKPVEAQYQQALEQLKQVEIKVAEAKARILAQEKQIETMLEQKVRSETRM